MSKFGPCTHNWHTLLLNERYHIKQCVWCLKQIDDPIQHSHDPNQHVHKHEIITIGNEMYLKVCGSCLPKLLKELRSVVE
jgi:hypothetical protein